MGFLSSLSNMRDLFVKGRYGEILRRILKRISPYIMSKTRERRLKYLYLRNKYRSFITNYSQSKNTYTGGGGISTDTPNIIWRLWLQGTENAPDVCKACLASLRRWHPDKKIITLDSSNLSEYITLPDYINKKYEQGIISRTHYSDLVRIQLLSEYGGTWADSTVYCTGRNHEEIMHLPLFAFKASSKWCASSNWFIVSRPHHPIIMLTRDLLFEYWKDYNYLVDYFIFHMMFKAVTEKYIDEWEKVPYFSNKSPHDMQRAMYDDYSEERMKYFEGISDFHKLTYKFDPERVTQSSILQHIIDTIK